MRTSPTCARAGRGAAWLLGVLVALGVLAWALSGGRDASTRSGSRNPEAPAAERTPPEAQPALPPSELAAPAETRDAPPRAEPSAPAARLGLLVVHVSTPAGGFAGPLSVVVRLPSGEVVARKELRGEELERADPARVEFACAPGEVWVEAEQSGPPQLAALPVRTGLAANSQKTVTLELVPARRVSGVLLDASGEGAAGVRIALGREGRVAAETRTGFGGVFALAPLPDERYELVVGDPLGPLLPREDLRLDARLEPLELRLPELLELEVLVQDENQLEVAGAQVEGVGESAGRVTGETDGAGRLHVEGLPPGNYRLFATHPTRGRGNEIFVLSSAFEQPLVIRLRTGRPVR